MRNNKKMNTINKKARQNNYLKIDFHLLQGK